MDTSYFDTIRAKLIVIDGMEKQFESYEYLVKYNSSGDNEINTEDQLYIVQENGHLVNVKKPSEMAAQEEISKEFESVACPIFDVSQQPLYFQLNNSSQLIPIPVNPVSSVVQSNVFENPFLVPNLTVQMIESPNDLPSENSETCFATNLKEESESMVVDSNKLSGGYAEITLNDDQYEILKQKGWILLEITDKVFLLDSSGLHEITNDFELIAKLKHEASQIGDENSQLSGCEKKVVTNPENEFSNTSTVPKQEVCCDSDAMDIINGLDMVHQEEVSHQVMEDQMVMSPPSIPFKVQQECGALLYTDNRAETEKKPTQILLKTECHLEDIPKEIVLGKTVNGKNLIARVIQNKGLMKKRTNKEMKFAVGRDRNITDKQFAKLVQQVLHGTAEHCRTADIVSVETVISQMFRLTNLRSDLHKHKIIVTRTVREENKYRLIEKQSEPAIVTGQFIVNEDKGLFVHMPDMLQQHMKNSELEKYDPNDDSKDKKSTTDILEDDVFLHVNITETKCVINNTSRVSVTVNKRYLSLSQVYNMKTKHINALYACTACAKVFKSQEELDDHRKYPCAEVPVLRAGPLPYSIVKSRNKMKVYKCNECNVKFFKLKECQEHLKLHSRKPDQTSTIDSDLESSNNKRPNVFKCKLCDNIYFHSCSLTKHILAQHIKPK